MVAIKIKDYEQISERQYNDLPDKERLKLFDDDPKKRNYYFKKTGKLEENLKKVENEKMAIEIFGDGIEIINKTDKKGLFFGYGNDFKYLVKTMKKAEELAEKYQKETRKN